MLINNYKSKKNNYKINNSNYKYKVKVKKRYFLKKLKNKKIKLKVVIFQIKKNYDFFFVLEPSKHIN
jgi:hypothetical protein